MTGEFQARASLSIVDTADMFVPSQVGVGILEREAGDAHPAVLGIHLLGRFLDGDDETGEKLSVLVSLDTERAVGLIIQLRAMLLDAGVSPGQIIAMMKEAYARFDEVRAMDRAPKVEP